MIQLVAVESFGQKARGKILGIITLVDSMSGTLGTVVASELKTSTGSYLMPFTAVVIVTLIAVINVLLIKPVWSPSDQQAYKKEAESAAH